MFVPTPFYAKEWVQSSLWLRTSLQRYQKSNVTLCMHFMVFHCPDMMQMYRSLCKFSGQGVHRCQWWMYMYMYITTPLTVILTYVFVGVGQNNYCAKCNFYSSNWHDPCLEVIQAENCLLHTAGEGRWQKWGYNKRDEYSQQRIYDTRKSLCTEEDARTT